MMHATQSQHLHSIELQGSSSSLSTSSTSTSVSAVRRFADDPRLRPFLSSRFDMQGYIHNVLKEGRSEECFGEISSSIDEVNTEIKGYISAHKSDLMSGMQDVALLSERYNSLSQVSDALKGGIVKLKGDVADTHGQIKSKIVELERIHETSLALRYLRQFVHSKGQLDHFLKSTEDDSEKRAGTASAAVTRDSIQIQNSHFDVRSLASVAKIVNELEVLIENPVLKGIKEVTDHVTSVRTMGAGLRKGTQTILFNALKNRNQSIIGACLQIFYHLQSLPEIILLVIDRTVKESVDLIQLTLDIDSLVRSNPDLTSASAAAQAYNAKGAAVANGGAVPTAPAGVKQSNTILTIPFPNSSAIASSVKEIAATHAAALDDQTMLVYILQKVLLKKEDSSTHQKFVDVIRTLLATPSDTSSSTSSSSSNSSSNNNSVQSANNLNASYRDLLSQGRFVDLFWERLSTQFQDILNLKLRQHPIALSRLYPSFRRLAMESMIKYQKLAKQDIISKDDLRIQLSISGVSGDNSSQESTVYYPDQIYDPSAIAALSNQNESHIFGSLIWGQNQYSDIYKLSRRVKDDQSPFSSNGAGSGGQSDTASKGSAEGSYKGSISTSLSVGSSSSSSSSSHHSQRSSIQSDGGLLMCYCAVRDRYLIGSLSRMTYPILQMFPEVDGYTAAIPSKRDIQTFFKAIYTELVTACIEGDSSLLQLVGKEALKAIQLMLSKLEAMVILSGSDITKLSATATSTFSKNSAQEHNGQLINILILLRDSLEKLPENITKQIQSEAVSSTFYSGDSSNNSTAAPSLIDIAGSMANLVGNGISQVEDLVSKQLLRPLAEIIMTYIRTNLLGLLREGLTGSASLSSSSSAAAAATSSHASSGSLVESSRAILLIQKQLPELVKVFYATLNPALCVISCLDELFQRVMVTYISIAASSRPVSEHIRLRVAKDLSAIEDTVTSILSTMANQLSSSSSIGAGGSAAPVNALKQLQQKYFNSDTNCLVSLEFRSLKRLLFVETEQPPQAQPPSSGGASSASSKSSAVINIPPTKKFLLSQPFITHIRPSTLLAHLVSSAPSLLPSPWEPIEAKYFEKLTKTIDGTASSSHSRGGGGLGGSQRLDSTMINTAHNGGSLYSQPWKSNATELDVWSLTQQSLDVFLQRISVAEESQRPALRAWYELIFNLGQQFFK